MRIFLSSFLLPAVVCVAASCAAPGGPYDRPYSVIVTDTAPSADYLLRPVIINRVDGSNVIDNRAVVPPGPHQVTVDVPPRAGFHLATQQTFELVTEPCTRYYVVARLESTVTQEWTPVVKYKEPMGDCMKKFGLGG
jgi:hypothetical protein